MLNLEGFPKCCNTECDVCLRKARWDGLAGYVPEFGDTLRAAA